MIDVIRHGWFWAALVAALGAGCKSEAEEDEAGEDGAAATKGDQLEDGGAMATPIPAACEAECTVEQMCFGATPDACREGCAGDHAFFAGEGKVGCVQKFEGLLTCVGGLDCGQAADWLDGFTDGYPCQFDEEAFYDACVIGGQTPAACVSICAKTAECEVRGAAECEAACTAQLDYATKLSEECGSAQTALLGCAEALASCNDLRGYYEGDATICVNESATVSAVCAM